MAEDKRAITCTKEAWLTLAVDVDTGVKIGIGSNKNYTSFRIIVLRPLVCLFSTHDLVPAARAPQPLSNMGAWCGAKV